MDKIREKFGRERDADVALIRADSAITEAAQLTTCPELAKDIEKLRYAIDDLSICVRERKNRFLSEIRKKEKEEMSKETKEVKMKTDKTPEFYEAEKRYIAAIHAYAVAAHALVALNGYEDTTHYLSDHLQKIKYTVEESFADMQGERNLPGKGNIPY